MQEKEKTKCKSNSECKMVEKEKSEKRKQPIHYYLLYHYLDINTNVSPNSVGLHHLI